MQFKKTMIIGVSLLCAANTAPVYANDKFVSEDIFQLEYAGDPQISPDGKKIVYVRSVYDNKKDGNKRSFWLYDLKSGQHTPLFDDEHSYSQPTWSPDSKKIAFTSNVSGSNQLHVYWLAQDKQALLTQLPKSVGNLTWSHDSEQIAFTMNIPEGKTAFAKSVKLPKKPKGADWSNL